MGKKTFIFSDNPTEETGKQKVRKEELYLSSELKERIAKAREEIKSGNCITLKSPEDLDDYFNNL